MAIEIQPGLSATNNVATSNKGTYSYNEAQIYSILLANNYNKAQICGILANIESECNFNHRAENKSEGAYGLCQWRDSRKTALFNKYGSSPSLKSQVHFIIYEFNSTEKSAYNKFKNISNTKEGAYEAGRVFAKYYERCAQAHVEPRAKKARDVFWEHYKNNNTSASSSTDLVYNESSSTGTTVSPTLPNSLVLSTANPYADEIKDNLSRVTARGFDYGYLIDLSSNREFKFYIPEFSESAGANWNDIDIAGRSSTIKAYNSTNSRVINISLDLYAGVGLYSNGSDVVGALHKDLNFVKSLEYPNYDNTITVPPPTVHLILGSAISLVGIVNDVVVDHRKPLDSQNRSMYVKLSFTVTQTASNPHSSSDIREGRYSIPSTENPSTLS